MGLGLGFGLGFGLGLGLGLGVDAREVVHVVVDPHARLVDAPAQGPWQGSEAPGSGD